MKCPMPSKEHQKIIILDQQHKTYKPIQVNVIETDQTDQLADMYRPKQA